MHLSLKDKKETYERLKKYCQEYLKNDELWKDANNLVFGKGNLNAEIFIIGEAPGKNEDILAKPFVGRAGKLLDATLKKFSLEDKVFISNVLKLRPPKNRNPKISEIKRHIPCLIREIEIVRPKIIVTLGNFPTRFVLNGFKSDGMSVIEGISKLNGEIKEISLNNNKFLILPIYHPAAVLYNPYLKEDFENSFKKLKELVSFAKKIQD